MSDTPKTDAIQDAFNDRDGMGVDDIIEAYEHARELERENTILRAAQKACEDCDAPTNAEVAALREDKVLLEALGRHIEFQVHDQGVPCFAMIDPKRRREIPMPLRIEIRRFIEECFRERL